MTYMALARKWRPKQFSEVMGQTHVVQALSNALNSGRVHHAYLFTGTRGVGKTTLARIFAKSLNCETGMSAEPCQQCSVCTSVDQGNYVDLIEVDAASRTGIDDMRELLDNVQYAPTSGHYKVYLIDEVHMLSKSSFNALLKTLEEPPEHVKFLFATTDPQKLPVTVLSRCLQFNLQALQPNQIGEQLSKILDAEGISYDATAIDLLSRAADGSLRDSLSLLEQAIAQGSEGVREDDVRAMLGTVKSKHLDALLQALIASDAQTVLSVVQEMANYSTDFGTALDQLLLDLHHISLAHLAESALRYKVDDVEKYRAYASSIAVEDIQLLYQIALISKRDLPLAPDHRSGFEMAMMRMLAFKPTGSTVQTALAEVENTVDNNTATATVSAVQPSEPIQNSVDVEANHQLSSQPVTASTPTPTSSSPQAADNRTVDTAEVDTSNDIPTPNVSTPTASMRREPTLSDDLPSNMTTDAMSVREEAASYQAVSEPLPSPSMERQNIQPIQTAEERIEPTLQTAPDVNMAADTTPIPSDATSKHEPSMQSMAPSPDAMQTGTPVTAEQPSAPTLTSSTTAPPATPPVTPRLVEANHHDGLPTHTPHEPQTDHSKPPIMPETPSVAATETGARTAVTAQTHAADPASWAGMLERLNLNGLIKELAMNMACNDITADPMVFYLSPTWSFLHNQPREDSIVKEIHKVRGDHCSIKVIFEDTVSETPAERLARLNEARMQQTKNDLTDDKGVQDLMNTFELSMNESSIKPHGDTD